METETDKPQVFYVYGHSFELDFGNEYWTKLEDFLNIFQTVKMYFTELIKMFCYKNRLVYKPIFYNNITSNDFC